MKKTNEKVLLPEYMTQFQCIGAQCEDTCCAGWTVHIDRKTYKKYGKVKDKNLKERLDDVVKRNRQSKSDNDYAHIQLMKDGVCPLLDGGLCAVQKQAGSDHLSNVCSTYPRHTNLVNNVQETSATLSCPEIARLALLNPNPMAFLDINQPADSSQMYHKILDTSAPKQDEEAMTYFWELRVFIIQLLQNRSYTLEERLMLLGMFIQQVDTLIEEKKVDEIPLLIGQRILQMEQQDMHTLLDSIQPNPALQITMLEAMMRLIATKGTTNQRYAAINADMLRGLQYEPDQTAEEKMTHYQNAYRHHYMPYFGEKEYVLENYVVNYVFKNLFPRTAFSTIFDEYVLLVILFSCLKIHLMGGVAHHKEQFNEEHIIKIVQSFSKQIDHNKLFLQKMHELFTSNEANGRAYMMVLLKYS